MDLSPHDRWNRAYWDHTSDDYRAEHACQLASQTPPCLIVASAREAT
jgi:hypothetical protein